MQTFNGAPPEEEASLLNREEFFREQYEDASKGLRFANYLIDTICVYVLFFLTVGLINLIIPYYTENPSNAIFLNRGFILLQFVYYTVLEGWIGKTAGKIVTKTKVVYEEDESEISFSTAMIRSLCRLIPFEPFSFLFSYTGGHDYLSKTRVVMLVSNIT